MINIIKYESEMEKIVHEEFGDILNAMDEKIKILEEIKELQSRQIELQSKLNSIDADIFSQFKNELNGLLYRLNEVEDSDSHEAKCLIDMLKIIVNAPYFQKIL